MFEIGTTSVQCHAKSTLEAQPGIMGKWLGQMLGLVRTGYKYCHIVIYAACRY